MGPFPVAPTQKKFLLVEIDYFTKWVETKAFATIKDKDVMRFLWKSIICRFGIPQIIIFDNGSQFDNSSYRKFCTKLGIKNLYSLPRYWQVSGQEEATNKSLLVALKKRLQGASGRWVEKLLEVLWAHLTMRRRPTGKTLFSLDYDMEVVIPTEIGMLTLQATLGTNRQSRDRS